MTEVPEGRRRMLQLSGFPINAETPLDALTSYLTPNELFFVRHHFNPTIPEPSAWRLRIDGEVSRPSELNLEELRRLPRITVTCVLQCAGNGRGLFEPAVPGLQWHYGAVGNARWTGVRVRDLLEPLGLKAGARHLHTFGSDRPPEKVPPFYRSLEIEKALNSAIVAYEMNGEPLPPLHGSPARLVIPGWSGNHWIKWLTRLSAQREPQPGFYMDVGYRYPIRPGAPGVTFPPEEMRIVTDLNVKSCITTAPARAALGSTVALGGFAFSGTPDIARVELSDDGDTRWRRAVLDAQHDPYAWRLWSLRWRPRRPGKSRLWVRAVDSGGSTQPREAVWNQSGYLHNGWHSVEIEVSA
jgi:DMSO/TMAO reductase YedYZ molybdopterin-dependent catalytic subunit